MVGFVYILELSNGKYYVGSTRNINERLLKHQNGGVPSTRKYLPLNMKVYKQYLSYDEAYGIERKLKKSKSRRIIEQYIKNNS